MTGSAEGGVRGERPAWVSGCLSSAGRRAWNASAEQLIHQDTALCAKDS